MLYNFIYITLYIQIPFRVPLTRCLLNYRNIWLQLVNLETSEIIWVLILISVTRCPEKRGYNWLQVLLGVQRHDYTIGCSSFTSRNGDICVQEAKINKIRTLYFLKL